ncbi:acyl carrier protein [Paenibacillus oryzisoli]|uniref:acyl carrier protein n=1 Tax=Paenibacillus oryzisoli TaxID=1850517 RepID=UPI003D2D75F6
MQTGVEDKKKEIIDFLKGKIAEITGHPEMKHEIKNDDPIKEMGIDSIKMVNLIVQIEQHFGIAFEDEELVIDFFSTVALFASSILDKLGIDA